MHKILDILAHSPDLPVLLLPMPRERELATLLFDEGCRRTHMTAHDLIEPVREGCQRTSLSRTTLASWRSGATEVPLCAMLTVMRISNTTTPELMASVIPAHPELIDAIPRAFDTPTIIRCLVALEAIIRTRDAQEVTEIASELDRISRSHPEP